MRRVLINTIRNIRRAPYQALAAVLVLTLTFFIAQFFIMLSWATTTISTYFETRPQVTSFFKDDVTPEQILSLKAELEKLPEVKTATYVSKQEALKIYQEQNKDDPLLLEMVTADILPASLEVSAVSVEALTRIHEELSKSAGIEEIAYQKDVVESLQRWSKGIRGGGLVLVGFLVVTSLLILIIIISMKVGIKRQEIATMRLLGASPGFVIGPFVMEGALYGLIASIIAWGVLYIAILYATPSLLGFLQGIPVLPVPFKLMLTLLFLTILFSLTIGMIAGSISSRRFGK